MKIIQNCVICGAPLDNPTYRKHYCPDCRSNLTAEWMGRTVEALKRERPQKPCVRCGAMIKGYPPNKRYCTECAIEVHREKNRIHKNAPEKCKSPSGNLVKKKPYERHRKSLPPRHLASIRCRQRRTSSGLATENASCSSSRAR